jgi:putative flippase GtrA
MAARAAAAKLAGRTGAWSVGGQVENGINAGSEKLSWMKQASSFLPLVRYTGAGALATLSHYAVLMAAVEWLRVVPSIAAGAGACVGAAVSYAFNRRFTFRASTAHTQAVPRFVMVALVLAALNALGVDLGTRVLGWPYLAAQVACTIVLLFVGFVLHRRWSFA